MNATAHPKVIILGAGKPLSGEAPAGLRLVDRQRKVLDWIAHAFRSLAPEFVFVGGYNVAEVMGQVPADVSLVTNQDWANTGSVDSLFKAGLKSNADNYVCYGDILFRDDLVGALAEAQGLAAAVDAGTWRMARGTAECLHRAGGQLGNRGDTVEYVGLLKIPAAQVAAVESLHGDAELRRHHIGRLIDRLIAMGTPVTAVDARNRWSSLDDDATLARFVLGTKADTLFRLRERLKRWHVAPQVTVTVGELTRDGEAAAKRAAAFFTGQSVAVRSSALCEDGFQASNAGCFTSLLNIPSDPAHLAAALREVADSYPSRHDGDQILVQPMVRDVVASGVALTRSLGTGAPYFTISFSHGPETDGVTSGKGNARRLTIYRDSEHIPADAPAFVGPLVQGLRELEYVVDYDALDVEFAVDSDGRLHLLQARPLVLHHDRTQSTDHNIAVLVGEARQQFRALVKPPLGQQGQHPAWGVMPDWNPAEIVGIRPAPLAFSLYRHLVTDDVWAQQRAEFGYRDVRPTPLIRLFAGHAFVDVRTSFNSFVPAALPDPLVAKLLDHFVARLRAHPEWHDKVEFEIVPTCSSFDMRAIRRRLIEEAGLNGDELALYETELKALTCRGINNIEQPLAMVQRLPARIHAIESSGMPALEQARALLHECRRHGSLPFAHLARHGFIAVTLLRSAVSLGVLAEERLAAFMQSLHTVARQLTADAWAVKCGQARWQDFVSTYGHLRPGTYEIRSQCYAEEPEGYLRGLVDEAQAPEAADFAWSAGERAAIEKLLRDEGFGLSFDAFDSYLRKAIEGRESSKFQFTRALSRAIEEIARWGADFGLTRVELSQLYLDELLSLAVGASAENGVAAQARKLAQQNQRWRTLVEQIELPPLLFAEQDLLAFTYPHTMPNFVTGKRVVAPLVNLACQGGPADQSLAGAIVMIPQADPGYDWLFGRRIAGLVTIYGGANSHMAIRAAEFGLPAAIGIGEQRYRDLEQARVLELDCGSRQIFVQQ
ncbi:MAG: PEP/pyruvate-binding domain-containing protein [Bacteroidales bacterium]